MVVSAVPESSFERWNMAKLPRSSSSSLKLAMMSSSVLSKLSPGTELALMIQGRSSPTVTVTIDQATSVLKVIVGSELTIGSLHVAAEAGPHGSGGALRRIPTWGPADCSDCRVHEPPRGAALFLSMRSVSVASTLASGSAAVTM